MQNDTKIDQQVRGNDRNGKEKMKMNADKFNHAKEHTILVGDTVLVRQQKKNQLSTRFDPEPYQVTQVISRGGDSEIYLSCVVAIAKFE